MAHRSRTPYSPTTEAGIDRMLGFKPTKKPKKEPKTIHLPPTPEAVKLIEEAAAANRKQGMRHYALVRNIDLAMLKRQKNHLVQLLAETDHRKTSGVIRAIRPSCPQVDALKGILHLLDAVQDAARKPIRKENLKTIRAIAEGMGTDQQAFDIAEICSAELTEEGGTNA